MVDIVDTAERVESMVDMAVDTAERVESMADLAVDMAERVESMADMAVDTAESMEAMEDTAVDTAESMEAMEDTQMDMGMEISDTSAASTLLDMAAAHTTENLTPSTNLRIKDCLLFKSVINCSCLINNLLTRQTVFPY